MSSRDSPSNMKKAASLLAHRNVTTDLMKEVTSQFISETLSQRYTDPIEDERYSQTGSRTKSRFSPVLSQNEVLTCEFHPSGNQVAYSRADGSLTVWKFDKSNGLFNQKCIYNHVPDVINTEKVVTDLSWNPTELDQLAAASNSNEILVWSVDNDKKSIVKMKTLQVPGSKTKVYKCNYSPNGQWLLCSTKNELIYLFSVADEYKLQCSFDLWSIADYESSITSISWDNSGSYLFVGLKNGKVVVLEIVSQDETIVSFRCVMQIDAHRNSVSSMKMDPQGRFLVVGSTDGTCSAWDTQTLCCLYIISDLDAAVVSVDINYLGSILAVTTGDDQLHFYYASDGKLINTHPIKDLKSDIIFKFHPNKSWYMLSSVNDTLINHTASTPDELQFWKKQYETGLTSLSGKGKPPYRDSEKSVPSGPSGSGDRKGFKKRESNRRPGRPTGPRTTRYDNR